MTGTVTTRWVAEPSRGEFESSRLDRVGERAAALGVGLLIVTGFASSYTTLRDLAVEVGGFSPWLAPVVPLSFDLGIVVLSLKVVLAARAGRDARVLRVLVLLLSAATVVANGAASSSTVGRLLHAVPPAMFVVCFETLAASARHDSHTRRAVARQDMLMGEVPPVLTAARWLLAPRQTWRIWRARILGTASQALMTAVPVPPAPTPGPAAPVGPGRSPLGDLATETAILRSSADAPREWPVSNRPAPATADRGPSPLLLSSGRGDQAPSEVGLAGQHDRLTVAVGALRVDPAMTAVALAEHLTSAGHPVSVRTAQRVRHQAEQHFDPPPPDTDALSAAGDSEGRSG